MVNRALDVLELRAWAGTLTRLILVAETFTQRQQVKARRDLSFGPVAHHGIKVRDS